MILTTTPTLEGHPIREYRGVVTGETIIGANAIKDFMAGMRDFFGGRSKSYESVLREAKDTAMREMAERAQQMGCNAVVGIDIDYETVGQSGSMLMVTCSGTGVVLQLEYRLLLPSQEKRSRYAVRVIGQSFDRRRPRCHGSRR